MRRYSAREVYLRRGTAGELVGGRTLLLPLNRSRRFRRDVIYYAVDAADFIDDTSGNCFEDVVRERNPVSSHTVLRVHRANGAGVSVGTLVAHHADRHYGQQDGKRLP